MKKIMKLMLTIFSVKIYLKRKEEFLFRINVPDVNIFTQTVEIKKQFFKTLLVRWTTVF